MLRRTKKNKQKGTFDKFGKNTPKGLRLKQAQLDLVEFKPKSKADD